MSQWKPISLFPLDSFRILLSGEFLENSFQGTYIWKEHFRVYPIDYKMPRSELQTYVQIPVEVGTNKSRWINKNRKKKKTRRRKFLSRTIRNLGEGKGWVAFIKLFYIDEKLIGCLDKTTTMLMIAVGSGEPFFITLVG